MNEFIKVTCTPRAINSLFKSNILEIRFFQFDVMENGFDPRSMTREDWQEAYDEEWVHDVYLHTNCTLEEQYPSLEALIKDIKKKETKQLLSAVRKERAVC